MTFLWCVLVLLVSLSALVLACFWVFSWARGEARDLWLRAGSSWTRGKSSSELSDQFASLGSLGLFRSRGLSRAGCIVLWGVGDAWGVLARGAWSRCVEWLVRGWRVR